MTAFYNENDPTAAHVLRCLIADGVIAPGVVDSRSIKELHPNDLRGHDQVHLFAGGGLWSVAARLAGWPDDRPLWTASCPCQPFSQAGQGRGTLDDRHLWPDVARLIHDCRAAGHGPRIVVGEQVAGKAGYDWFNGVRTDLAAQGYGAWVVDIPSCAVDAPHIRQRLYWAAVADGNGEGSLPATQAGVHRGEEGPGARHGQPERHDGDGRDMADAGLLDGRGRPGEQTNRQEPANLHEQLAHSDSSGRAGRQEASQRGEIGRAVAEWADDLEHATGERRGEGRAEHEFRSGRPAAAGADAPGVTQGDAFEPRLEGLAGHGDGARGRAIEAGSVAAPDGGELADPDQPFGRIGNEQSTRQQPVDEQDLGTDVRAISRNGSFWSDHEWLICHDGKARRVPESRVRNVADEFSGSMGRRYNLGPTTDAEEEVMSAVLSNSLLVPSFKGRTGAWKLAGNAIVPELAAQVLAALMETLDG